MDKEAKQRVFGPLIEELGRRKVREAEVKDEGKNTYLQLEARLTDTRTSKLKKDPVIHAIQSISKYWRAKDFLQGYVQNITDNPEKYPHKIKNPYAYAIDDIQVALTLHFSDQDTHKFWQKVLYDR